MLRGAILLGVILAAAGALVMVASVIEYQACEFAATPHCAPGAPCPLLDSYCSPVFVVLSFGVALLGLVVAVAGLRYQVLPIPR